MRTGLVGVQTDPQLAWFVLRASGLVLLVVYTLSTALGIASRAGEAGRWVPRFVTNDLHRRVSLFSMALLLAHVATAVLDNYVVITWTDGVVPFAGSYRPLWLGLGTLALDVLLAVVVTSLLRHRIGHRTWLVVHYAVYAAWPLMVLHALGTGTDARRPSVLLVTLGCVVVVLLAVVARLLDAPGRLGPARLAAMVSLPLLLVGLVAWTRQGPLAPGWSHRAGTPPPAASTGSAK